MVSRPKDLRFSVAVTWRGMAVMGSLCALALLLAWGKDDLLMHMVIGFRDWLLK